LILLFICLPFLLCGCFPQDKLPEKDLPEYSFEEVIALDFESIEHLVVSVPYIIDEESSTFELKEVTRAEDRMMIREFLAALSVTETDDYGSGKGFDLLIEIKGEKEIYLVFADNLILINNRKYYITDNDTGETAVELYRTLDYDVRRLE